jgi:hypothetical protein
MGGCIERLTEQVLQMKAELLSDNACREATVLGEELRQLYHISCVNSLSSRTCHDKLKKKGVFFHLQL